MLPSRQATTVRWIGKLRCQRFPATVMRASVASKAYQGYGYAMPDRSRKRPRDLNALAASIVNDATAEEKPEPADDGKDPAAVALGRRGGLKGGQARAARLTPEQRSDIARKAAAARWSRAN